MTSHLCFASSGAASVLSRPGISSLTTTVSSSSTRGFVVPVERSVRSVRSVRRVRNVRPVRATAAPEAAAEATPSASETEAKSPTTITQVVETPGGYIVDATVMHKKRTSHSVVIGKEFVAEIAESDVEVPPEVVVESVFDFFIHKKHDLSNTKGMQDSGVFPINYFSLRQVFYVYPEVREYLQEEFKKRVSK